MFKPSIALIINVSMCGITQYCLQLDQVRFQFVQVILGKMISRLLSIYFLLFCYYLSPRRMAPSFEQS